MLVLTRFEKQKIVIGGDIVVQVLEIEGDFVKLGITAPKDVRVDREEIHLKREYMPTIWGAVEIGGEG